MSVNLSRLGLETKFPHPNHGHNHKAVWRDDDNVVHRAIGAEVHRGVRLLWTACERKDIPANEAWLMREGDVINCEKCLEKEQEYG
jgi:hypothetical protein